MALFSLQSLRQAFEGLFGGMSFTIVVCLILGLSLIIIEFFQSTKWLIGSLGITLTAGSLLLRLASGGTAGEFFVMLLMVSGILFLSHAIMLFTQKRDWLNQSLSLAIEATHKTHAESKYAYLLGAQGVSTTEINPNGQILINEVYFSVTSNEYIAPEMTVKVVEADGEKIMVERIK